MCGQAFPIADGHPVNNFIFLQELLDAPELFRLRIPSGLAFFGAFCIEVIHSLVGRLVPFEPLLTRAEVCKVGYTHYFNMERSQECLGYRPLVPYSVAVQRTRQVVAPLLKTAAQRRQALKDQGMRLALFLFILYVVVMLAMRTLWALRDGDPQ